MNLTPRVVFFVLCALFVAAIAARISTTEPSDSPYFKGASAMAYRHMVSVADGHSLDAPDSKELRVRALCEPRLETFWRKIGEM